MKAAKFIVSILFGGWISAHAADFMLTVEVAPQNPSGVSWDLAGGAPDIRLRVDGQDLVFAPQCRDTYRCTVYLPVKRPGGSTHYFEVYDRDLYADDLVGKGECLVRDGLRCRVGEAVLRFEEVIAHPVTDKEHMRVN